MTNKPWKLILLLMAIFVAGGVTGAFVTMRVGRRLIADRTMPEQWAPMHLRKLADRLNLQPEQVEQLKPIVRRNLEELGRLRNSCLADSRVVFERMEREVAEKLTPEQRVKFEELNRQMRERAKRLMPGNFKRPRPEEGRPKGEPPGERTPPTEKKESGN
jgi:Spy/CpxP family protein refolding chaperone